MSILNPSNSSTLPLEHEFLLADISPLTLEEINQTEAGQWITNRLLSHSRSALRLAAFSCESQEHGRKRKTSRSRHLRKISRWMTSWTYRVRKGSLWRHSRNHRPKTFWSLVNEQKWWCASFAVVHRRSLEPSLPQCDGDGNWLNTQCFHSTGLSSSLTLFHPQI